MADATIDGLDIGLYSVSSTRDNCAVASKAEARGFRRLWLAEAHHSRDIFVQATAVAAATKEIEIGLGIVNPYTRHPAQIAMAVADLEEWGGARVVLGLGAAWSAINAIGLENPRPIRALKEAGEMCRRLLNGERFEYQGEIFRLPKPGAKLTFPLARRDVPLYYGTMGPRTLKMAAASADGLLFSVFCSPAYAQDLVGQVGEALAQAGRSIDDVDIACYIIFSVDQDGDAARQAAKWVIANYVMRLRDTIRYQYAGLDVARMAALERELRAAVEESRFDAAVDDLPDDIVRALAVAGTPEECVAGLKAYAAAGIKRPVLYHTLGPDRLEAIDTIADSVRPHLLGEQDGP